VPSWSGCSGRCLTSRAQQRSSPYRGAGERRCQGQLHVLCCGTQKMESMPPEQGRHRHTAPIPLSQSVWAAGLLCPEIRRGGEENAYSNGDKALDGLREEG
jgi:collagenase-like PrtC family protease